MLETDHDLEMVLQIMKRLAQAIALEINSTREKGVGKASRNGNRLCNRIIKTHQEYAFNGGAIVLDHIEGKISAMVVGKSPRVTILVKTA